MPAQEEREIASQVVRTDKCEQMYGLKLAENPLCQWFLSSYDSWKEMNTPQNHHDNCRYPALADSVLRSRTGKAKTRLPSQVEAEAIGRALGKIVMNGGAP